MIDDSQFPVAHPQVAARIVDGTAVILLSESGEVNVLNDVGTRVWELSDGAHSVGEILATIVVEYAVTLERAHAEVYEFLQTLIDARMVILRNSPI